MKLLSARVRNYRVHKDLAVIFDSNPTLIAGPNESGKSTLVEAIHRGLFLKSKTGGEVLKEMKSDHGGHPEVEVTFETEQGHFTVRKRFSGNNGTTTLEEAGKPSLNAEEAEDRLASVLGVDGTIAGRGAAAELERRWAHLWIWQGKSGNNPTGQTHDHHDALVSRLQAMGGGGAIQSDLDRWVHEHLKAKRCEVLLDSGKPRAGTPLCALQEQLALIRQEEAKARDAVDRLDSAVRQYEEAGDLIDEKTPQLAANEDQLRRAQEQQKRVLALRQDLQPVLAGIQRSTDEIEQIRQHTRQIESLSRTLPQLQETANDAEKSLGAAIEASRQITEEAVQREGELDRARKRLEQAQQRRDDLHLRREWVRARQTLAEAKKLAKGVEKLAADVQAKQQELACLPKVTTAALAKLRQLQEERVQAEADLKAMSTQVEVIASEASLRIAGKKAKAGSQQSYSGAFEIEAGESIHLRVTPGGGESIVEAREAFEEADTAFCDTLKEAEATTLSQAEAHHAKRAEIEAELKSLRRSLDQAGGEEIRERLQKAEQTLAAATAKWDRLPEKRREESAVEDDDALTAKWDEADSTCDDLNVEVSGLKENRSQAAAQQQEAAQRLIQAQQTHETAGKALDTARVQLGTLESTHGTTAKRQERLDSLTQQKQELEARQAGMEQQLQELGADQLDAQIGMLTRSVEQLGHQIQQARESKAAAGARLQEAGTTDPIGDLADLRDRRAGVESRLAAEEHRIKALQSLVGRFDIQVSALEQRFTQPLLERVGGYLALLFGHHVRAEARYQNGEFQELALNRSGLGLGTYHFDSLSGGTREQLGVAFRLAVAEILAEDHDGCLPLVLDDALVNSDPERVKKLLLMVYQAAAKGLQIILCTCNPPDYAGSGAHEIRLSKPLPRDATTTPEPEAGETEDQGQVDTQPPSLPPQPGDEETFLTALRAAGGSSGNIALRKNLGWDEARYGAAKESLLAKSLIQRAPGKGGAVRLLP